MEEVAARLAVIDEAALRAHFDPERMSEKDVYPSIWYDGEDAFEYLVEHFAILRRFYADAAKRKRCVLVHLG